MGNLLDELGTVGVARGNLLDELGAGRSLPPGVGEQTDHDYLNAQGEFIKGLRRGGYSMGATSQAAIGQALEPIAPETSKSLISGAQQTLREMPADVAPKVNTYAEAKGLSGVADWAASKFGEAVPSMAAVTAGSLLGAGVGALGRRAALGRVVGGVASMVPPEMGESALDIHGDPVAMANSTPWSRTLGTAGRGGINALAENLVPQALVAPHLLGKAVRSAPGLRTAIGNVAKLGAEGAIGEYGTEYAQELTGQALHKYFNPDKPWDLEAAHEAGLSGLVPGVGMGTLAGGAHAIHSNVGPAVDAAAQRIKDAAAKIPFSLNDAVTHLRGAVEDPEAFGQKLGELSRESLTKMAEVAAQAKQLAGEGLEAAGEITGKARDAAVQKLMTKLDPDNREWMADKLSGASADISQLHELLVGALKNKDLNQSQEDLGALARQTLGKTKDVASGLADWAVEAGKGVAKGFTKTDAGEKAALKVGVRSDAERRYFREALKTAVPELGDVVNEMAIAHRRRLTDVLMSATEDASFFNQNDPVRKAILDGWTKHTGTDLKKVLEAVRTGERANYVDLAPTEETADDRSIAETPDGEVTVGETPDEAPGAVEDEARGTARSAEGETMGVVDKPARSPFDAKRLRQSFSSDSKGHSKAGTRFPVQLSATRLTATDDNGNHVPIDIKPSELARAFGRRFVNRNKKDTFVARKDVRDDVPLSVDVNPMSMAAMVGSEGNREDFGSNYDAKVSPEVMSGDRFANALGALTTEGLDIEASEIFSPEELTQRGLKPDTLIHVDAGFDTKAVHWPGLITKKKGGEPPYTLSEWGKARGMLWSQSTDEAKARQQQNYEILSAVGDTKDDFEGEAKAFKNSDNKGERRIGKYVYKGTTERLEQENVKRRREGLPALEIDEKSQSFQRLADDFMWMWRHRLEGAVFNRLSWEQVSDVREAYEGGDISSSDIDDIIDFYRGDTDQVPQVMDRLELEPVPMRRDMHADALERMKNSTDARNASGESIMLGKGEEAMNALDEEFEAFKLSPQAKANLVETGKSGEKKLHLTYDQIRKWGVEIYQRMLNGDSFAENDIRPVISTRTDGGSTSDVLIDTPKKMAAFMSGLKAELERAPIPKKAAALTKSKEAGTGEFYGAMLKGLQNSEDLDQARLGSFLREAEGMKETSDPGPPVSRELRLTKDERADSEKKAKSVAKATRETFTQGVDDYGNAVRMKDQSPAADDVGEPAPARKIGMAAVPPKLSDMERKVGGRQEPSKAEVPAPKQATAKTAERAAQSVVKAKREAVAAAAFKAKNKELADIDEAKFEAAEERKAIEKEVGVKKSVDKGAEDEAKAEPETPKPTKRRVVQVNKSDSAGQIIAKLGGIRPDELTRDGVDPSVLKAWNKAHGNRAVRKDGKSLDGVAEILAEYGFDVHDENGLIDATKAREILEQELNEGPVHTTEQQERLMDKGAEAKAKAESREAKAEAKAEREAIKAEGNPPKPPKPPGEPPKGPPDEPPSDPMKWAREKFIKLIKSIVGDRVKITFGHNLGDAAATFQSREDRLKTLRNQIRKLKDDIAASDEQSERNEARDALKDLEAEEKAVADDHGTLGFIKVAAGMEQRAGLAEHEAFHAAFAFFLNQNKEDRRVVGLAFSQGMVAKRLREHFKDQPKVLEAIEASPEEAAAYGFQLWMADPDLLKPGPQLESIYKRFWNWVNKLLGFLSPEEKTKLIFEDLKSGGRAEKGTSPIARVLDKERPWQEKLADYAKDVSKLAGNLYDIALTSTYKRLVDMENPHLTKIAKLGYEQTGEEGNTGGMIQRQRHEFKRFVNQLGRTVQGLSEGQLKALHDAMIFDKKSGDEAVDTARTKLNQFYKDLYQYQVDAKVDLKNAGLKSNYYPLSFDPEKVLKNKEKFLEMTKKYEKEWEGVGKTPLEVWEGITSYIERGDEFVSVMGENDEPTAESTRRRSLGFISKEDRREFMADDPVHTAVRYIKQAVRQAEFVRAFDPKGVKLKHMLEEAKNTYGATPDQIALATDYIDGLLGNKEVGMSRELKDLYGALNVYQNYRLLPFNLFSSLVDPIGVGIRSNSIGSSWETFTYSMKNLFKEWKKTYTPDQWEMIAADWGIIEAAGTTVGAHSMYDGITMRGTTKELNDKLFKYNLLNGWIRSNTIMATKAAQLFMHRSAEGKFGETHSARYLEELGLTKDDIHWDEGLGRLRLRAGEHEAAGMDPKKAAALELKLRNATEKFVRQSLLQPSTAELPNWASNPYLMPIAHLKQFMWSFNHTITNRITHELEHGNMKPVMLAAAYVPGMIAADWMKDMISNAGSEPPYKENWGVVDYLRNGTQRSGLTGTGQIFDAMGDDMTRGGSGLESFAGPTIQQLQRLAKASLSNDPGTALWNWVVKALPLMPAYDQFLLKHGGGTPEMAPA